MRAPAPAEASWEDMDVRTTTRRLVSRTEGVALLAQGCWIATTAYVDRLTPQGQLFLFVVAILHVAAAAVASVTGGPFVHGGGWKVLWIGAALVTPLVMGALVPFGEYGASPACVQLCGYPVPPIIFIAFYPWTGLVHRHLRPGLELLLVSAFVAGPVLVVLRTHAELTSDTMVSLVVTSSIYLLAFGVGRAVGRICREATHAQIDAARAAQKAELDRTYNTLHDQIETALGAAVIHHGKADLARLGASLRAAQAIITRERTRSLLTKPAPPVAKIVDLQVDLVKGVVPNLSVSPVGQLTVRPGVAELLASALGALLKNVSEHADATSVHIDVHVRQGQLHVEVADDGRGLDAGVIDDPATSLHALRERVRAAGGDLVAGRAGGDVVAGRAGGDVVAGQAGGGAVPAAAGGDVVPAAAGGAGAVLRLRLPLR